MKTNLKNLLVAGSSLTQALALVGVAQSAPALAAPALVAEHAPGAAEVNLVSMHAIESSFLDVPRMCKDRSAAFDPMIVGSEQISAAVQAAHAELDARVAQA